MSAPAIASVEEMLELVAAGTGVAITAASVPVYYSHPGVRFVTVSDLTPNRVLMCARKTDRSASVAAFASMVEAMVGHGGEAGTEGL
ncbi:hypothetical protein AB0L57_29390 [Nocardia sp. NPDC052254]|uniref:hypothetical protein n=1 Tax=Nocardia sp. NPDC052254 TaxID=3155681 RepID=UPI003417A876